MEVPPNPRALAELHRRRMLAADLLEDGEHSQTEMAGILGVYSQAVHTWHTKWMTSDAHAWNDQRWPLPALSDRVHHQIQAPLVLVSPHTYSATTGHLYRAVDARSPARGRGQAFELTTLATAHILNGDPDQGGYVSATKHSPSPARSAPCASSTASPRSGKRPGTTDPGARQRIWRPRLLPFAHHEHRCRAPYAGPGSPTPETASTKVLTTLREEAGLGAKAADGAKLIKFTNNAVYRLPGAGMVVRIAGSATVVERVPVVIQAARWLAHNDAPSVRPVEEIAQPVEAERVVATFWHLVPARGPKPTGTDLGRILKRLHALPAPDFPLPSWEPFERIRSRIADAEGLTETDRGFLAERTDRLEAQVQELEFELPAGVIHGDPFAGNLIPGGEGPVICDFDSLSHGPREWDLVPVVGKVRMDYPTDPRSPPSTDSTSWTGPDSPS